MKCILQGIFFPVIHWSLSSAIFTLSVLGQNGERSGQLHFQAAITTDNIYNLSSSDRIFTAWTLILFAVGGFGGWGSIRSAVSTCTSDLEAIELVSVD